MIKILGIIPAPNSGVSFYRSTGVLNELHRQGLIHFDFVSGHVDWDLIGRYDIIFMERPYTKEHVETASRAIMWGKKVVIDYDDFLFDVQKDNPVYHVYHNVQIKKNMLFMLNNAHAIICSTDYLKGKLQELTSVDHTRFHTVPNALNDYVLAIAEPAVQKGIMYRGSGTHRLDCESVKEAMIEISKQQPITFFGHLPEFIKDNPDIDYYWNEWNNSITAYYSGLANRLCNISIVPLLDNDFNRSKSNIAVIEAVYAGACVIAPNFPEFRKIDGVLTYDTPETFEKKVKKLLSNSEHAVKMWQESKDYINGRLLLSQINPLRLKIFDSVLK